MYEKAEFGLAEIFTELNDELSVNPKNSPVEALGKTSNMLGIAVLEPSFTMAVYAPGFVAKVFMSKANAVMGLENVMVSDSVVSKNPIEVEPRPLGLVVVRKVFVTKAEPSDGV